MGTSFKVELEELEQARTTLQNLLTDVFNDISSPVHPVTFQNNTASSMNQGQYSAQTNRIAQYNDAYASSNFGPMDQGIPCVTALNQAHGQAHQAVLGLLNDLNTQINALLDRANKTHQAYSGTEDDLQVAVNKINTPGSM